MSIAIHAHGTKIRREMSPGVFETVAEAGTIVFDGPKVNDIEVTSQDSPGAYKEFISGLRDGGTVSFPINFDPANATQDGTTGVIADLNNGTQRTWRVEFVGGSGIASEFPARVIGAPLNAPVDGAYSKSGQPKIDGAV